MKRNTLNFIVDLAAFLDLLGIIFTGFIMEYILPPGTGACGQEISGGLGREHIKDFLSMTRHEWGDVHFILALLFIVLMAAHVLLHWAWICNYCGTLFSKKASD
ncbi:MAG: DUF4405 domain-containing protein [Planctomycetota bacterium]|jgi:hypothetical protein